MTRFQKSALLVFLVLLVDQTVKIWIKTHMTLGEEVHVFGDWFRINFVENNGMAFGMEFWGDYGKLFLSLFRIVAVIGIGYYIYRLIKSKAHTGYILSISLIFAGAIGNIIDSAFYGLIFNESTPFQVASFMPEDGGYAGLLHGKVVDMLYFPLFSGTYPEWFPINPGGDFTFFRPVFNIADSAISVGVFIILLFQRRHLKDKL
ncbi:MAG: lipoprotein signal peptidase [Bacteroidales bacterium]|jgi:signal peptidase II|nr:lipoprotein signal peptidase [Bacteroidales bacterium]